MANCHRPMLINYLMYIKCRHFEESKRLVPKLTQVSNKCNLNAKRKTLQVHSQCDDANRALLQCGDSILIIQLMKQIASCPQNEI